jgi:hypothetical protein
VKCIEGHCYQGLSVTEYIPYFIDVKTVILSGIMVIVLATGPKAYGSNPTESNRLLRAIKIHSMTSLEGKQSCRPQVVRFYGMLKIPRGMTKKLIGKIQHPFLARFLPTSLLGVSAATSAQNSGE